MEDYFPINVDGRLISGGKLVLAHIDPRNHVLDSVNVGQSHLRSEGMTRRQCSILSKFLLLWSLSVPVVCCQRDCVNLKVCVQGSNQRQDSQNAFLHISDTQNSFLLAKKTDYIKYDSTRMKLQYAFDSQSVTWQFTIQLLSTVKTHAVASSDRCSNQACYHM